MIISSIIGSSNLQKDGRTYVTELHTTDDPGLITFSYLAVAGIDTTAIMNARRVAYNLVISNTPTVTVTMDDGTTATLQTYDFGNLDLRLTAGQKTALQTAKTVLDAIRPLVKIYNGLTPAQQTFVTTHSPWFASALAVLNG